jgi:colicin import membrane protein
MGALLACKKKPDAAAEASASAVAPPAPPAPTPAPSAAAAATTAAPTPAPVEAKLGDVKRYGVEKESKLDDAGVRVSADELKVYNEADTKTDDVATLPKGLLVFRQVKMDDFTLVEFPSGVGQFSQGWVETKSLSETAEKVTRDAALSEKKTATVKVKDGGAAAITDAGAAKDKDAGTKETKDAGTSAKDAGTSAKDAGTKPEPPPDPNAKKAADKAAADKAAAEKAAAEKKKAAEKKAAEKKAAGK